MVFAEAGRALALAGVRSVSLESLRPAVTMPKRAVAAESLRGVSLELQREASPCALRSVGASADRTASHEWRPRIASLDSSRTLTVED